MDLRSGRQRGISGRRRGRDKTVAMSDRSRQQPSEQPGRAACRDPPRRAAGAISRSGLGGGGARALCASSRSGAAAGGSRAARGGAWPRAGARRDGADRRAAVRSRQRRRLRGARRRYRGRVRHRAAAAHAQRRGHRLRTRAGARSRSRLRDHDRDRRRRAARRRRGGDDRAHRAGRECDAAGDRRAPRVYARPVHLLCGLRHRARRTGAAPRHAHRVARDRHAGGLRHRAGRCRVAAQGGGAFDRRRTGARRATRSARRRSTTATAPSWRRR